jgi:hypothetical protein
LGDFGAVIALVRYPVGPDYGYRDMVLNARRGLCREKVAAVFGSVEINCPVLSPR